MVIRDLTQSGPNNRGGSYTNHHIRTTPSGGHVLYVDGPPGAVAQVRLTDPNYVPQRFQTLLGHPLDGAGSSPVPAAVELLELLRGVVTVPCGEALDFAVALDWYKKIVDDKLDGHTDLADLVYRGKYWYKNAGDVDKLREVGRAIVGELVDFIGQHPLLRGFDAIAAVPGHDARVVSFGTHVARAVGRERGIPVVRCTSKQEFRTPAKNLAPDEQEAALAGQFDCPADVSGQQVLIVDDVYRSGVTAQETARAIRAAGASRVASLAVVRTMRSR
jgi:adenine/guanine phosphoribosyltransferase-like PRPP-binding protein